MKLCLAVVACFAGMALACATDKPLDVAEVDLAKLEGGYFEIAKLPRPTQADCAGTTAFYRRVSPTELAVVHECREGSLDGRPRRSAARAVVPDPNVPAKLSLDVGGFFGDYWIVEVADDYRYLAVGHPSRDYLWILSRTPALAEDDFAELTTRLKDADFDVSRLEFTEQRADDGPVRAPDDVPPLETYGCGIRSTGLPASGASSVALVVAAAIACARITRRRRSGRGAAV